MRKLSPNMLRMLMRLAPTPWDRHSIIHRVWIGGLNPTAKALLARGLINKTGELTEAGKKVLEETRDDTSTGV